MDPASLEFLAPLGVGGILAGVIFWFYRKDANAWQESWKGQSVILVQVVKENTAAITALVTLLQRENRQ